MKYEIIKATAPAMPNLGKGTECIRLLLSQTSKDMHEPLVPMLFPILGAHVSGSKFQYPDLTWKELCGQMANLVAESGGDKSQLSHIVETKIAFLSLLLFLYQLKKFHETPNRRIRSFRG